MDRLALQVLFFPLPTTPLPSSFKNNKFEDLIWHTVVPSFIDTFLSFFGILTVQKGFRRGELPENYKMLLNKTTPRYFRGYKIKIQSLIDKQKSNTFPVATQWMTCKL